MRPHIVGENGRLVKGKTCHKTGFILCRVFLQGKTGTLLPTSQFDNS